MSAVRGDAPETAKQEAVLHPIERTARLAETVAGAVTNEALRTGKNVVGGVANFLGAAMSTPKAALIHEAGKAMAEVNRNPVVQPAAGAEVALPIAMPPVRFSPTSSLEQLKAIGVRHPALADVLTDIPTMSAMNFLGAKAALPAARAIANLEVGGARVRALPGIKQAAEFVSTGASLPNRFRTKVQRMLRTAEGEADWSAYLREKRLGPYGGLSKEAQDRVQTAIEKRTIPSLAPNEQGAANALLDEYANRVANRLGVSIRPHELGAHIPGLEADVAKRQLQFQQKPDRLAKLRLKRAERRLQKATQGVPAADRVAFTDRPMTTELRAEAGLKRYGTPMGTPGGLGTGRLAQRAANPSLTTQQINAAMEAQGKPRFAPVIEAAHQMGAANDVRVMHGRILRDIVDEFGIPTTNEAESVAKRHIGVATGFNEKYQRKLLTHKLPPELDELVGNLNKRLSPNEWNRFQRANIAINNEFKRWALFSPGFVSRNMQNNVFQTMMFGNYNPATWGRAFRVRYAMQFGQGLDNSISVGGKSVKIRDYIESAIKRGVFRGQTTGEIPKGYGVPFNALRAGNQFGEDVSRAAFDIYNQGKGLDPVRSAERVDQVLFNYSSRTGSRAKSQLRRYYYPFINWDSQIGPLAVRTALERPGSLGMVGKLTSMQNEAQGFTPQDIANLGPDVEKQGGIVTSATPDTANVLLPQGIGTYSANELIPSFKERGWLAISDQAFSRSYPTLAVPYSLLTKRDLMTDKSWEAKVLAPPITAPSALKVLFTIPAGRKFAEQNGLFVDDQGTVKAPMPIAIMLRSIPQTRLVSVIVDRFSASKDSDMRLKSFLYGVREVQRERGLGEEIQRGKEHGRRKELHSNLRQYPDSLREQLHQRLAPMP